MQFMERGLGDNIITSVTATALPAAAPSRCDPQLSTRQGQLYARVVADILAAQPLVANGTAGQNGMLFTRLAQESRDLGTVQGQIDACTKPTTSTVAKLTKTYRTNLQDLVLIESRFSQSWLDHDYRSWMTYRTSIQERHRIVAKYAAWISQAQAAPSQLPGLVVSTTVKTSGDAGGQTIVSVPGTPDALDPSAASGGVVPFYKRPVVWLTALGIAAGVGTIGFFSRR